MDLIIPLPEPPIVPTFPTPLITVVSKAPMEPSLENAPVQVIDDTYDIPPSHLVDMFNLMEETATEREKTPRLVPLSIT